MIIQCAWCKRPMRQTEHPPQYKISWSICDECGKKLLEGAFQDGKFTFQVDDQRTT